MTDDNYFNSISPRQMPKNTVPNNQTVAFGTPSDKEVKDCPEKSCNGILLIDLTEDSDEEPEKIRDETLNDSLVTEFRERFQKLEKFESPQSEKSISR